MYAFFQSILEAISSVVGNHGIAVILFTLLIRLIVMPFDYKSRKSMRRMEKVNPQLQALQKKYANDRDKLQRKQADLYKKEKINPLGSCLPMLLTFPVLIVMFGAMRNVANERLVESMLVLQNAVGSLTEQSAVVATLPDLSTLVEPFLWIKNLWMPDSPFTTVLPLSSADLSAITGAIEGVISADELVQLKAFLDGDVYQSIILPHYNAVPNPDLIINLWVTTLTVYKLPNGFFILPILSIVTQFFSNSLNPQQQQQQGSGQAGSMAVIMKWVFPIMSLMICATSNAAFALYWVATNILTMIQQSAFRLYFDMQDRKAAAQTKEVSL